MTTACKSDANLLTTTCIDDFLTPPTGCNEDLPQCPRAPGELAWSPGLAEDETAFLFPDGAELGDIETDDSEDENYGMARIREIMTQCRDSPTERPALSYIAMIGMAILTSSERRLLLSDIYAWILEHFAYFKSSDRSWRNSVRHNLSLNECFVKMGRADNGKGNYWIIHPANVDDFSAGDFRRRMARIKVRQSKAATSNASHSKALPSTPHNCLFAASTSTNELGVNTHNNSNHDVSTNYDVTGWVPMTSWTAPVTSLIEMFGADAILSSKEMGAMESQQQRVMNQNGEWSGSCYGGGSMQGGYFDGVNCAGVMGEEEYMRLAAMNGGAQAHSYMYPYM